MRGQQNEDRRESQLVPRGLHTRISQRKKLLQAAENALDMKSGLRHKVLLERQEPLEQKCIAAADVVLIAADIKDKRKRAFSWKKSSRNLPASLVVKSPKADRKRIRRDAE